VIVRSVEPSSVAPSPDLPAPVVGGAVGAGAGAGAGDKAEDVAKDDVNRESDWSRERTTDEVVPPR